MVCTGKYGDIPLTPTFPRNKGPEVFKGKVLHTIDYCKLDKEETSELVKGKKVVVVGYKKSAIDLALECAQANQGKLTTLICPFYYNFMCIFLLQKKNGSANISEIS